MLIMPTLPGKERPVLSPKHLKALELIERGGVPYTDIAKQSGLNYDYLWSLIQGEAGKDDTVAGLFLAEIDKINKKRDLEIKSLFKSNKKLALKIVDERLCELKKRKPTSETTKEVSTIMKAMGSIAPKTEIGEFHYTVGLSAEDLLNEFRRVKGLASDRRGVFSTDQTGTGEVPGPAESGDTPTEESEAPILHPSTED